MNEFETFEQHQLISRIRDRASWWGFAAGIPIGFVLGLLFVAVRAVLGW